MILRPLRGAVRSRNADGHGPRARSVRTAGPSALRRQRAGVGRTQLDPLDQLLLGPEMLRSDPDPAAHPPAAHHRVSGTGPGDEAVRLGGIRPDQHAALAAHGDAHVAVDEERKAAEHLLLRDATFAGQELAYSVGEVF